MKKDVSSAVMELMEKMRQEIAVINSKIDTLINKASIRPAEIKPIPAPGPGIGQGDRRQDNSYRERVLHKAVCADCKKGCEVPFKPSGERPVYCKECFSKRKIRAPFKARPDNGQRLTTPVQAAHADKPQVVEKKKPVKKKKPSVKRRK